MGMSKKTAIDQIEAVRNSLAALLVIAFIGALTCFTFVVIPPSNKDILTYMVGQLSGMATTALGFYFVSKVGQDALDAKRADNTGKLAEAVTAAIAAPAASVSDQVEQAADETAQAAKDKADDFKGSKP